jgi:NAD(P)-dependent dehydrogenase (short-subunit alcohol dehydrogenase family)
VPLIHKLIRSKDELARKSSDCYRRWTGIGKALTKRFLSGGIKVVIAEIDDSAGSATEAEYQHLGSICFIKTDVSSESSVINLIKETEKDLQK